MTTRQQALIRHLKMVELYLTGKHTHKQVANKLKVSYSTAFQFYLRNKIEYDLPPTKKQTWPSPKSGLTDKSVKEAHRLYKTGLTLQQIGVIYGNVSRERIRQVFKKYGLKIRKAGIRIHKNTHCDAGHKLRKYEYRLTCKRCKDIKRTIRSKKLHLKTHCINGHEYTEDNTHWQLCSTGKRGRRCVECTRAAQKRHWLKGKTNENNNI